MSRQTLSISCRQRGRLTSPVVDKKTLRRYYLALLWKLGAPFAVKEPLLP
ncbi:Hypothetical predicted protein [Xyrichtys novacula]|uniref:Uncharacterized protein n=1 Tax=Xyrichtys novacula TaxID=13765 RepID=A0AAV1F2C5_XYRNO|nr:Hypothetical predicted protein [Xyrichtys novacula]